MTTVDALLNSWLPEQRWFAGKGRVITAITQYYIGVPQNAGATDGATVTTESVDADARVEWLFADVEYADGDVERYSIPLTIHASAATTVQHAIIGQSDDFGPGSIVCDALLDRNHSALWLQLLSRDRMVGEENKIHFDSLMDQPVEDGLVGDLISTEQSNSSVVYGDQIIIKFFRRLEKGINPDVEIHQALAPQRNPHIAPMLGAIRLDTPITQSTLAMAQQFLPTASDGFSLGLTSVRDLLADLERAPAEAGGDFASEAYRLGAATASVHADLAKALPTDRLEASDFADLAVQMTARLEAAVLIAPEIAPYADGLRSYFDALADLTDMVPTQRIHGDFHLGQTMRTVHGWIILDFEGEPAKSIIDRKQLDTPLKDIAGMLRSFDYASRALLVDESRSTNDQLSDAAADQAATEIHGRESRAAQWRDRNCDAFCAGYAHETGTDPRDSAALLLALQADKLVYEVVYESRHRPKWLSIPLDAIRGLAAKNNPGGADPQRSQ